MPERAERLCAKGGCYGRRVSGSRYCLGCGTQEETKTEFRSQEEKNRKAIYDTTRWRRVSFHYRKKHPLCECCLTLGRVRPSCHVHHKIPIRKGGAVFLESNLLAVCISCHNQLEQELERSGGGD